MSGHYTHPDWPSTGRELSGRAEVALSRSCRSRLVFRTETDFLTLEMPVPGFGMLHSIDREKTSRATQENFALPSIHSSLHIAPYPVYHWVVGSITRIALGPVFGLVEVHWRRISQVEHHSRCYAPGMGRRPFFGASWK